MAAEKSEARGQTGRREKLTGRAEGNAGSGFTQACSERRAVDLLWLMARSLVHIDVTLSELQTLTQQQADLLRAILATRRGAP